MSLWEVREFVNPSSIDRNRIRDCQFLLNFIPCVYDLVLKGTRFFLGRFEILKKVIIVVEKSPNKSYIQNELLTSILC